MAQPTIRAHLWPGEKGVNHGRFWSILNLVWKWFQVLTTKILAFLDLKVVLPDFMITFSIIHEWSNWIDMNWRKWIAVVLDCSQGIVVELPVLASIVWVYPQQTWTIQLCAYQCAFRGLWDIYPHWPITRTWTVAQNVHYSAPSRRDNTDTPTTPGLWHSLFGSS